MPLFAEVRGPLEEVRGQAMPGARYVITRSRDDGANLRTQLTRIIRKAGLTPWPKLWQNLRSTRQTELAEIFPAHVVCEWIGNSEAVSRRFYLQVTDIHFERAAGISDEKNGAKTVQTHIAPSGQQESRWSKSSGIPIIFGDSETNQYPQQDSNLQPSA